MVNARRQLDPTYDAKITAKTSTASHDKKRDHSAYFRGCFSGGSGGRTEDLCVWFSAAKIIALLLHTAGPWCPRPWSTCNVKTILVASRVPLSINIIYVLIEHKVVVQNYTSLRCTYTRTCL